MISPVLSQLRNRKETEAKEPFQRDFDDDCGPDGAGGDGDPEPCYRNPEAGSGTSSCVDGGSGSKPDLRSSTRHPQLQAASKSLPRPLK